MHCLTRGYEFVNMPWISLHNLPACFHVLFHMLVQGLQHLTAASLDVIVHDSNIT